ncbi:Crp/Fnr family transcriptional regulator [Bradyrhizobium sp. ORS 111]|uniref:Crp/Fnr family transcriptional regulator n=1 Tax=Bradyrhizobium sp. ORS 111 TaxID=1685958 RepID=UPI00388DF704
MPIDMMIRKLRSHSKLDENDVAALRSVISIVRDVAAEALVVQEGSVSTHCCVMLSGFSYRAKVSDTGRRQILSFHIAGDMPDLHGLFLRRMDHDLVTLSQARIGFIEHQALKRVLDVRPAIMEALWRETLLDAVLFREWIVSLGTRPAASRMAYLVAELRQRLAAIGLLVEDQFRFPITQSRLAEALGLSTVHVNRVLQSFRARGILDIHDFVITLGDIEKIVEIGGFNDLYLQASETY